jgi:hypothetical protein
MDEDDLLDERQPAGEPDKRGCPKCGSADVRPSSRDGFWAAFFALLGRTPYRCRSCRGRFYRNSPSGPIEND